MAHDSQPRPVICPACTRLVHLVVNRETGLLCCPECGRALHVPAWHFWRVVLLAFAASLFASQAIGLRAYAAVAWVPLFVLALIAGFRLMPPRLAVRASTARKPEEPWRRTARLFLIMWVALTFFLVAYGFVLGWSARLLGGAPRDLSETDVFFDFFSVPLGWLNPAFVIRPYTSFVATLGIVFANSFFYAAGLLAVFRIVHAFMRRNCVTQLGISPTATHEDDDPE